MKQKSAEILAIGTELLMGNTVNTNAAYIARGLAQNGINVFHQEVVGDNPKRLLESLQQAFSRSPRASAAPMAGIRLMVTG